MSTTLQAFNSLFKNFIDELASTFPEEKTITVFSEGFDDLVAVNARKPIELFVAALAPHSDLVMAKNDALFDQPLDIGIAISELWKSDISDGTREAIWQYIHMLFLLGTTVLHVPSELLGTIENVAQTCATRLQDGNMDMSSMASMFMNGMGSILGGMPAGGAMPSFPGIDGPKRLMRKKK